MNFPGPRSSTRSGFVEWLVQRLSALYVAGFSIYLGAVLVFSPPADYQAWRAWLGAGSIRLGLALFVVLLLIHAWIGMRSIFIDYLHPLWLRLSALIVTATGLLALGIWAGEILLRVAA